MGNDRKISGSLYVVDFRDQSPTYPPQPREGACGPTVDHAHGLGGQASSAGQPDPQPKRETRRLPYFSLPLTLAGASGMKAHNPRPM
jgi:hypothetical protein